VLDIMMPRVDGWMALMDIRSDPLTASIPVIMLTAKTEELAKILAFKQGVQQYVTKPFNVAELAARVQSLARGLQRRFHDCIRW
jgi:two-component system, OmpR family, alkaline phosphatase synthesis response regulator PhoP